jgi:hypothetical protein
MRVGYLALTIALVLVTKIIYAQVGIGTATPETTLQIKGDPGSPSTADGIQIPSLTLAQLNTKIAAYGTDQDGAIVYINYINLGGSQPQTAAITERGFYYYDAPLDVWKIVGTAPTTYNVGDFAHGGIVFWVDETGQHGLVCTKTDQGTGFRWYAGTFGNTQAKGDGPFAGNANTSIVIAAQVAIGDDGSTYAARICNELQITEGGKTYGDWYLPSKEELNLMYQNKTTIDATAIANSGSAFNTGILGYWSSTEINAANAWEQYFSNGFQDPNTKFNSGRVRAVRTF